MAEEVRTFSDLKSTLIKAKSADAPEEGAEKKANRDAQGRAYATGRRKNAVARVWIKPGRGQIVVNGMTYNGIMVPMNYLSDEDIANVLTYVRNSFGNSGDAVIPQEVARIRQTATPPPTKSEFE